MEGSIRESVSYMVWFAKDRESHLRPHSSAMDMKIVLIIKCEIIHGQYHT